MFRNRTLKKDIKKNICPITNNDALQKYFNEVIWEGNSAYRTADAKEFFNIRTLAPLLGNSKIIPFFVTMLVGLGVLGTFIGLTKGLNKLTFVGESDIVLEQIKKMTDCAGTAFITSVWGVSSSLALGFFFKVISGIITCWWITPIQKAAERKFPLYSSMDIITDVRDNLKLSKTTLDELAEKIGNRMQTAIEGQTLETLNKIHDCLTNYYNSLNKLPKSIGTVIKEILEEKIPPIDQLKEYITDVKKNTKDSKETLDGLAKAIGIDVKKAIDEAMYPAVNELLDASKKLNERNEQHSQEALHSMIEKFLEGVGKSGQNAANLMNKAADELKLSLEELKRNLDSSIKDSKTNNQTFLSGIKELLNNQSKMLEEIKSKVLQEVSKTGESERSIFINEIQKAMEEQRNELQRTLTTIKEELKNISKDNATITEKIKEALNKGTHQYMTKIETVHGKLQNMLGEFSNCLLQQQKGGTELLNSLGNYSHLSDILIKNMENIQKNIKDNLLDMQTFSQNFKSYVSKVSSASSAMEEMGRALDTTLKNVDSNIKESAELVKHLVSGNTNIATQFTNLVKELDKLFFNAEQTLGNTCKTLQDASTSLSTSADATGRQFSNLANKYQDMQKEVASYAQQMHKNIDEFMNNYNEQVAVMLDEYGKKVCEQTTERLRTWNEETENFCKNMTGVVQAMGEIIDDMEKR